MRIDRVELINIYVSDMQRSSEFYARILDRHPTIVGEERKEFALENIRLALHIAPPGGTPPARDGSLPGSASLVLEVENLEETCRALRNEGIAIEGPKILESSLALAFLRDPDGLPIELSQAAEVHRRSLTLEAVPKEAVISLREITAETVWHVCRLSDTLEAPQKFMVAPNAISIAQAHFSDYAWFRAIYANDTPIGFVMVYIGPKDGNETQTEYFLWRYMIAKPYQGMGFGRKAIELVIEEVKRRGGKGLGTSCGEGPGSPEGFYRSLGFQRSGEKEDDEVVLRLYWD